MESNQVNPFTRAEDALRKIAAEDQHGYFGKIALDALADIATLKGGESPTSGILPEFDDPAVRIIYNILCADESPPAGEHWEGWCARRIAADLAALKDGERLTDSYVQPVPDKCDRITWRNNYYHLPLPATFAALAAQPVADQAPIPMILHCPACGKQHIDAPVPPRALGYVECDGMPCMAYSDAWTNPPHRSHLCHACGHIWRPADVATTGVAAIQTKGKNDSPVADQAGDAKDAARYRYMRRNGFTFDSYGLQWSLHCGPLGRHAEFSVEDADEYARRLDDAIDAAIAQAGKEPNHA